MTSPLKILGAAALIAATAAPVFAEPDQPVRIAVKYTDLDLGTTEGRAALESRIEAAAREACGMDSALTTGSRMPSYSMRTCYKQATSQIGESIARAVERREAKS